MNEVVLGCIHHFLTDKWDIRVTEADAKLLRKHCPYFSVRRCKREEQADGRCYWIRMKAGRKIPAPTLSAYYKSCFEETRDELWALLDKMSSILE